MGDLPAHRERDGPHPVQCVLSRPPNTLQDASSLLRTFCSDRQHVFWPDSVRVCDPGRFRWTHVQGHRQLTDVYLLALSVSDEGRLATFDSTISLKAVEGAAPQNLELLAA